MTKELLERDLQIMGLADKFIRVEVLRAALAAADAKRAELDGGKA